MKEYTDLIMLLERVHRIFLDVVKMELDSKKVSDINNVQAMIVYNIGRDKLTVGEVTNRGYYLGSNVTYNLKKMIENGYLIQQQSPNDKRSSTVRLSKKGEGLLTILETFLDNQIKNLATNNISSDEIKNLTKGLEKLESFWSFMIMRLLRS